MPRHDHIINNDVNLNLRSDLDSALSAIETKNSGAGEDPVTRPYKVAINETDKTIRMRDGLDQTWNTIGTSDVANRVISKSSGYLVKPEDYSKLIVVDATASDVTIDFTNSATLGKGFVFYVKKLDSTSNKVILDPNGNQKIDDLPTIELDTQNQAVQVVCDGTNFYIINVNSALALKSNVKSYNHIINGSFDFFQRRISFSTDIGNSSFRYVSDRTAVWGDTICTSTPAHALNIDRSTDVPGVALTGVSVPYSLKVTNGSSIAACIGSPQHVARPISIRHVIPGYYFQNLYGKAFKFVFSAKSTVAGDYTVIFKNKDNTRYYATTVSITSSYQKFVIEVPSNETGTWLFNKDAGMIIDILLRSEVLNSVLNTWTSASHWGAATQVDFAATASSEFNIAGMSIDPVKNADILFPIDRQEEHLRCSHFYTKSYAEDVFLGANDPEGGVFGRIYTGLPESCQLGLQYPIKMITHDPIVANSRTTTGGAASTLAATFSERKGGGFSGDGDFDIHTEVDAEHQDSFTW